MTWHNQNNCKPIWIQSLLVCFCLWLELLKCHCFVKQQGLSDKTHQDLLGFEILQKRLMACVSSDSILKEFKAQNASTIITSTMILHKSSPTQSIHTHINNVDGHMHAQSTHRCSGDLIWIHNVFLQANGEAQQMMIQQNSCKCQVMRW